MKEYQNRLKDGVHQKTRVAAESKTNDEFILPSRALVKLERGDRLAREGKRRSVEYKVRFYYIHK